MLADKHQGAPADCACRDRGNSPSWSQASLVCRRIDASRFCVPCAAHATCSSSGRSLLAIAGAHFYTGPRQSYAWRHSTRQRSGHPGQGETARPPRSASRVDASSPPLFNPIPSPSHFHQLGTYLRYRPAVTAAVMNTKSKYHKPPTRLSPNPPPTCPHPTSPFTIVHSDRPSTHGSLTPTSHHRITSFLHLAHSPPVLPFFTCPFFYSLISSLYPPLLLLTRPAIIPFSPPFINSSLSPKLLLLLFFLH